MLEANPTIARAGQGGILSQAALRAANMAALSSLFPDISLSSDLNLKCSARTKKMTSTESVLPV